MPIFATSRSQNRFLKNSKSTPTTTAIMIKPKTTPDIFLDMTILQFKYTTGVFPWNRWILLWMLWRL
jgi:hypothetical protein